MSTSLPRTWACETPTLQPPLSLFCEVRFDPLIFAYVHRKVGT